MIAVSIDVDVSTWWEEMDAYRGQVAFALAVSVNETAKQFQRMEVGHISEAMTVRRPDWVQQSIKITHFATKGEPLATIAVQPPGDPSRADILGKFEDETEKQSRKPGGHVAIPLGAKRTKRDIIRNDSRPTAFHFRQVGTRILGDQRTFIVRRADGTELILQRVGKGAGSSVRALYLLVPRVHITPDLQFVKLAQLAVDLFFDWNFTNAFERAIATAR
jgi:hypothetical protein